MLLFFIRYISICLDSSFLLVLLLVLLLVRWYWWWRDQRVINRMLRLHI
jgi:hypothetical protein